MWRRSGRHGREATPQRLPNACGRFHPARRPGCLALAGTNYQRPWHTPEGVGGLCLVNFLGPYTLTRLLEGALQRSAPARVRRQVAGRLPGCGTAPIASQQQLGAPALGCAPPASAFHPPACLFKPPWLPFHTSPPAFLPLHTPPRQVINLSSVTHRYGWVGDAGKFLQSWRPGSYYPSTKLANVLFAYEAQRRLGQHGVQVRAGLPAGCGWRPCGGLGGLSAPVHCVFVRVCILFE